MAVELRKLLGKGGVALLLLMPASSFAVYGQTSTAETKAAGSPKTGPTADNQSNKKSDVRVAADIRKAVIADKSLSMRAHNVKIIVRNGAVTLRGPVNSEAEKSAVREKAEQVAGAGNVTDMITIHATDSKKASPSEP